MSSTWGPNFSGFGPKKHNGEPKPRQPQSGWIGEITYDPAHLAGAIRGANQALFEKFPEQILLYANQLVEIARIARAGRNGAFSPGIAPLTIATLRARLSEAVGFTVYNGKKWVMRSVPTDVVAAMLDAPYATSAKPLAGIAALPMIRPDGSIRAQAGFDPTTAMVVFEPPPMAALAEHPTRAETEAAVRLLIELLDGFPFDGALSRAVALSAMLTAVARPAIQGAVPIHLTTSPEPGSGKSYFADCIALLATAESAYATAASTRDEETEKRLIGQLIAGLPLIVLDNWNTSIGGDALAQATSLDALCLRPLGTSELKLIANKTMVVVNGLNPLLASREFERRTLHSRLDANSETPWMLTHARKPKAELAAERGRFVAAALTVIRFGLQTAHPPRQPYEAFDGWDRMVRAPLLDLGLPDPLDSQHTLTVRAAEGTTRADIFEAAYLELDGWYSPAEILAAAGETFPPEALPKRPRLAAALADIGDKGQLPSRNALARWLTKNKDRIVNEIKLRAQQNKHKDRIHYKFEATAQKEMT